MPAQIALASPGEEHDIFIKWATQEHGITVDGISPVKVPGSGLGVRATRAIKKGELLSSVPTTALLTVETAAVKQQKLPQDCTVHGQLAAYLTLMDGKEDAPHQVWQAVWPKREEFDEIMPMKWDDKEKDLLTAYARDMLMKQESKIAKDWDMVQPYLSPGTSYDLYSYYWMIVNTRTFYWDYPKPAPRGRGRPPKKRKLASDDCMALCPFMEYFNHADEGCIEDHDATGYTLTSDRDYEIGEELYLSYGNHSNDFLLVEYGFILEDNKWDVVKLDHELLPRLSASQKEYLKENQFLGDYTIDVNSEMCYRTQVASRILTLPKTEWHRVTRGLDDGEEDQDKVDRLLTELFQASLEYIHGIEERTKILNDGYRKKAVSRRWKQVEAILNACTQV